MPMKPRATPRMTFSSLCEYLSASPVRQISLLREQKYPKFPVIRRYSSALQQIQDFAVEKRMLNPLAPGLEPHEQEVIEELLNNNWGVPSQRVTRPPTRMTPMKVKGVEISVFPDLLLANRNGKRVTTGSMKFFLSKTRELDADVARWMASFLYCYKHDVERDANAYPDLCMIYNVRTDEYFEAGKSYKRLFQNIEGACQFISALWPSL